MALIADIILQGVQMSIVLLIAPLLTGVIRKVKARLLRRRGASVIQPYYDLWRLLHKEALMAENASWLYRVVPYAAFAAVWVAAALVPTFAAGLLFNWAADLLAIVALLGTARFALALAGMDVGTGFGGIGSSREMMIASLAEPAMLMIIFTVALLAQTTQLSIIAYYIATTPIGLRVSLGLILVALVIVSLAENARIPVDNPSTHLELTMVHEAMVLEYSGRHLAIIELTASLKLVFYMSLFVCIFAPFGIASPASSMGGNVIGMMAYLGKLMIGGVLLAVGETMVAKMRVFRVAEFLGGALVLGLLATVLLFVSRGM
ncbi:MAG: formate hydrogenlyase [Rhodospirillales bacterium RIFCSPLOWO2_12_FULL_58_28]|nr:MAG: formate hydrogenlyase [Rhodospirillales bacterium RIFCSPLOWO2_02_FULL_58_16]OHC77659.1 MAG: formate hydrogenlyase [Rhodospirillales bacterium RIFCSPLOWO2_12_FULL_58_28]